MQKKRLESSFCSTSTVTDDTEYGSAAEDEEIVSSQDSCVTSDPRVNRFLFLHPSKKIADAKLAKDFQAVLKEFQKAQQTAAERETAYTPFVPPSATPSRQELVLLDNEAVIKERESKGRVFALQDEPEVARVWLPNSDSPGLAMARAFGDFCLKYYGLVSVPDTNYRRLTERDHFIILASDG
ncbi:unnamed protein product, partial [Thlaspi arvense]